MKLPGRTAIECIDLCAKQMRVVHSARGELEPSVTIIKAHISHLIVLARVMRTDMIVGAPEASASMDFVSCV